MNLTLEYLRKKGLKAYLHEQDMDDELVLLAYAKEACYPEYHWCHIDDVQRMLDHWEATGELLMEEQDWHPDSRRTKIAQPDIVRVLLADKQFTRRTLTEEPGE
jgi:hypothetical protein